MSSRSIRNKNEYQLALKRLEIIFNAKPGTDEGDELEVLGLLIKKHEDKHFPIELPDPIEAKKFRMEQMDNVQKDA